MSRRSPEQVHDDGGHKEFVASCTRCVTEVEQDQNAAAARAELVGESGPELIDPGSIDLPSIPLGEQDTETVPAVVDVDELRIAGRDGTFDGADLPPADAEAVDADQDADPEIPRPRVNGRPKCYVDTCPLPEYLDDIGLCGGHWSTRPDLRKKARHG